MFFYGVTRIISIHRRQKQALKLSKHEVQKCNYGTVSSTREFNKVD